MDKNKKIIIISIICILIVLIPVIMIIVHNNKKETYYTVNFDTDNGTIIGSQTVKENEKVSKPNDPEKDGYLFVEWALNGSTYDFDLPVTSDLTLIAKYEKASEETYVVTFDSDGGSNISSKTVNKNSTVSKPSNPTKNGYKFIAWLLDGKEYDFSKPVTTDITLVAKWEKDESTTTNTTNTTKNTTNTTNSTKNTTTNNTTKSNTNTNSSSTKTNTTNSITNSIIVSGNTDTNTNTNTSQSTTVEKQKYTVSFDANGGSSVASQTVTEGSVATQPTNPTRSGYTFAGWTLNGSTYDFNSAVTSNITLVAKWTANTYIIKGTKIDEFASDILLSVYENGTKIAVKYVKYSDGTILCSASNMTVNQYDIETNLVVVLNDGTSVNATYYN